MRPTSLRPTWQRPVLSLVVSLLLALAGVAAFTSPAQAANTDVKINEVESNGGTPGDWVELTNIGAATVDIGGFQVLDNDNTHPFFVVPAGTMLAPGGFYVADVDATFGLGAADSARLYAPGAVATDTPLDTYSWTAHAASTYGRCPDGTGAFTNTTTSRGAANICSAASVVKINEIQNQGTPSDWIELKNTGATTTDISGFILKDSNNTPFFTVPAATTIPGGGYYTADVEPTFSLDASDSARLFAADGTTLVDSFTWLSNTDTTYGRCPDGTGTMTKTAVATKNAANSCRAGSTWPGGSAVSTVDTAGYFGTNLSGLIYQGTGTATPGVLWGVKNGPSTLYRLVNNAGSWVADTGDWAAGKALKYTDGTGDPDAEGVTFTDQGPGAGVFVSTERNNSANTVSRPAILEYLPNTAGSTLSAVHDWNLTPDLPGLGPNLGLEAISWVPDSYLTAKGFKDQHLNKTYSPADYANHGNGLFLVGVENTGNVHAYALDLTSNSFQQVATFDSGFPSVMDLNYEPETKTLWVECDNTCNGQSARFDVNGSGAFAAQTYYERPAGMGNFNNEGFATTPRSECVGGVKPVFWSDDDNDASHALRQGTLSCTPRAAQTVAFTSTAPTNPVVTQTYTPAATGGASGNPVVLSVDPASAAVCSLAAGKVTFNHPGSCVVKADQAATEDFAAGSAVQTITVAKAGTATTLTTTDTQLKATVALVAPATGVATGLVTFAVDGIVQGSAPLANGVAVLSYAVPHDGRPHSVVATYAGTTDLAASTGTSGRADPTITAAVSSSSARSATGWYTAGVTVTFTCSAGSGVLVGGCPSPVTFGAGADQGVSRTVTTTDGGTATATVSGINVDLDRPVGAIKGAQEGQTYPSKRKVRCAASDYTSGIASCVITQKKKGRTYVVTATVTDVAGHVESSSIRYFVRKKK